MISKDSRGGSRILKKRKAIAAAAIVEQWSVKNRPYQALS